MLRTPRRRGRASRDERFTPGDAPSNAHITQRAPSQCVGVPRLGHTHRTAPHSHELHSHLVEPLHTDYVRGKPPARSPSVRTSPVCQPVNSSVCPSVRPPALSAESVDLARTYLGQQHSRGSVRFPQGVRGRHIRPRMVLSETAGSGVVPVVAGGGGGESRATRTIATDTSVTGAAPVRMAVGATVLLAC